VLYFLSDFSFERSEMISEYQSWSCIDGRFRRFLYRKFFRWNSDE